MVLRGYKLRGIFYGEDDVPVERQEVELPESVSGREMTVDSANPAYHCMLHLMFCDPLVFRPIPGTGDLKSSFHGVA